MKVHATQRLFWKKWPYKAIIAILPERKSSHYGYRSNNTELQQRGQHSNTIKSWCRDNFEDCGLRQESNLSVFLHTESELELLLDKWDSLALEVWKPSNANAERLLLTHTRDIIRATPWYGKFEVRACIKYTDSFINTGIDTLKSAVNSLDPLDWHASGLLKHIISNESKANKSGWGQPLFLYLRSSEDAALLRLQLGDFIDRFERIRNPE